MNQTDPIYNRIGNDYNSTRKADPYLFGRLEALLEPQPGKRYLDIGCGTGNYTIAFAEKQFSFWGIEPSPKMLDEAKTKSGEVNWQEGSAENIPAADQFFDGAIATLTIHHWRDLEAAFKELDRVLKKDAKLVIFTSTPEQMEGYWHNHYFPKMMQTSIEVMPSMEKIRSALSKTSLRISTTEKYDVRDDLQDGFLYVGKNDPERYFDPVLRKGISSFSALSNIAEVQAGLEMLRKDIDNGNFHAVHQHYANNLGDYLFMVMEKTI